MSGNYASVGPLKRIDTKPDAPEEPEGNGSPMEVWERVLDMLRKQNKKIDGITDRMDDVEKRTKKLEANVELVLTETRHNNTQIATLNVQCARRCELLEEPPEEPSA